MINKEKICSSMMEDKGRWWRPPLWLGFNGSFSVKWHASHELSGEGACVCEEQGTDRHWKYPLQGGSRDPSLHVKQSCLLWGLKAPRTCHRQERKVLEYFHLSTDIAWVAGLQWRMASQLWEQFLSLRSAMETLARDYTESKEGDGFDHGEANNRWSNPREICKVHG